MKQILVSTAYKLEHSKRYQKTKAFVNDILNNSNNPYKKYVDMSIIFLIISSVAILIYEVKNPIPRWADYYDIYFVSLVFLVEYLLRIWVFNDISKEILQEYNEAEFLNQEFTPWTPLKKGLSEKLGYMLTPTAIIDLLAIFPAYRPIRILRIFVLFRVFKLLRYTKSIKQFMEVLANKRFELLTLLFLLMFVVMTAGIALYVLEEQINPNINSLFDSLYWALVTISTVGYGDISPVTHEGRVISMMIIISGIAMISFATSVIVSAFSEKLGELKENRVIEQINKSEEFLIICGYGQLSKMFLRQADKAFYNYIILEKDPERVSQAIKDGYNAIEDDASKHDTLVKFNVEYSNITVLCLANSDIENIYITLNAKSLSRKINVIARASDSSMVSKFERAGADHILLPNSVANAMLLTAISNPVMYKAIHSILTGRMIDEVTVYENDKLAGKMIKEVDFREKRLLFIGIQRGRENAFIFNPAPEMVLKKGDILLLMGIQLSLNHFKKIYRGGR
ncbi:MAG: NAD-binding protein [Campylobacterota bacterium]|nr:NAD-binding protein [Campylobacterota bacterium]